MCMELEMVPSGLQIRLTNAWVNLVAIYLIFIICVNIWLRQVQCVVLITPKPGWSSKNDGSSAITLPQSSKHSVPIWKQTLCRTKQHPSVLLTVTSTTDCNNSI